MPIYEYMCQECNKSFEYLVMGREDPACPECNSTKVMRLMSACGFISKGAGGQTVKSSTSSCSGCTSTNCSSCGH